MSDVAVGLVAKACREKFPAESPAPENQWSASVMQEVASVNRSIEAKKLALRSTCLYEELTGSQSGLKFINEQMAQIWSEKLKGEAEVFGWTSSEVSPGVFLVSFTAKHRGEDVGLFVEVQTAAALVRSVSGDVDLEAKYQVPKSAVVKQWFQHFGNSTVPDPYK